MLILPKAGHILANCRDKKIDYICKSLIEDLKRREVDKKERIERAIKIKDKEKQNLQ